MRQQRPPNNPRNSKEHRFKSRPKQKGKPFKKFQGPPKGKKAERRPPPKPAAEAPAAKPSSRAPEQTNREPAYLKELIDNKIPIVIRMRDNEEFTGTLEYYDRTFVRLTRGEEPNLFIFKHDIKYLYESPAAERAVAKSTEETPAEESGSEAGQEEEAGEEDAA